MVPDGLFHRWQEHSFGCNYIALHSWVRPNYYFCVDRHNFLEGKELIARACHSAVLSFINQEFVERMSEDYDVTGIVPIYRMASVYGKTKFLGSPMTTGFSTAAPTVLFVMMQFAYGLGYNNFLLVGIDGTYGMKRKHFYDDTDAPKYNGKNESEDKAWRAKCDFGFGLARQFLEERGGSIINLTDASTTTHIFNRGDVNDWI